MQAPAHPHNEVARLARLHALDLLDTEPEAVLDGFTKLAARVSGLPIALISLVDARRQWFKSAVGLPQGGETPREVSFCGHAILSDDLMEVPDAALDARFADNPAVVGGSVAHYAGAPLILPEGARIGTLCVAGPHPGKLDGFQRQALVDLAAHVVSVLLLREQEHALRGEKRMAEEAQLTALSPVGLFSTDARGRVLQANAQCAQLLGVEDPVQMYSGGWWRKVDAQDAPALQAGWEAAVRLRETFSGEFRVRQADGDLRWVKVRVAPVERNSAVAFVGGAVDVSETKRLEAALENKNRLLHTILEHLPCGLTVFDGNARHVLTNREGRAMLGLQDEQFDTAQASLHSLLGSLAGRGDFGADPAAAVQEVLARFERKEPRWTETMPATGRVIDMRAGYMPDGSVVTTYTDTTAERRAAAELGTSQGRLTRALEASRLGLWEYDCASQEIYLAAGWSHLLGLPEKEQRMTPRLFMRLVPAHEAQNVATARRQLLRGEVDRISLEHQMRAPGGQLIWLLTEAQVTERSADGRALRAVGTSKNITQRKEADSALRNALRAADQANRAKSEFLATMSHEIRTPLNGVIGLTELLSCADLPTMEADSVAMIDSCAKSLLSVVDNILDISRIEAGRLTLDEVQTDVRRLVREVGDVFTVRSAEKGVRFALSIAPEVPQWVIADPIRLRQILLNLLGNALKFTPTGRFSLSLRLAGEPQQLAFAVEDTGIGISPEHQKLLFTRFSQVDSSNTRKYSGSGLGLAISRQLSQLMGGDVELVSCAGTGSTFTLHIPLRVAEAPQGVEPAPRGQVHADAAILLAEDNVVNQLVAQRLLGMLGYRNITLAQNGREAMEACRDASFDLVLMDCQMPEMDGWEAARRIRAMGGEMPIVALTASAVAGDRERCLMAGMNDYITKPIESAVLAERVERWIASGRATQPAPLAAVPAEAPPVPDVFDREAIATRFFGDVELFQHCRKIFLGQTQSLMDELGERVREGDSKRARYLAHSVKGSAANLGAVRLADYCGRIEEASAEGALPPHTRDWLAEAGVALHRFTLESAHVS